MPTKSKLRIAKLEGQVRELRKGLALVFELAMRGRAFSEAEEKGIKAALGKIGGIRLGKWKCGDYVCISGGQLYSAGDKSQVAFPFGGGCPSVAAWATARCGNSSAIATTASAPAAASADGRRAPGAQWLLRIRPWMGLATSKGALGPAAAPFTPWYCV